MGRLRDIIVTVDYEIETEGEMQVIAQQLCRKGVEDPVILEATGTICGKFGGELAPLERIKGVMKADESGFQYAS